MVFAVELGHWEHPQYPLGFSGLRVEGREVVFVIERRNPAGRIWLAFALSILGSIALMALAWLLFRKMLFLFIFAPVLFLPLLGRLLGPTTEVHELRADLADIANVGGGGRYIAFGLYLPDYGEISVMTRLVDPAEAARLRAALSTPPAG